jgi:hypothetical protein
LVEAPQGFPGGHRESGRYAIRCALQAAIVSVGVRFNLLAGLLVGWWFLSQSNCSKKAVRASLHRLLFGVLDCSAFLSD